MCQALDGFQRVGLDRAFLEVTCQNDAAIRALSPIGLSQGPDHLQGGGGRVFLTVLIFDFRFWIGSGGDLGTDVSSLTRQAAAATINACKPCVGNP